MKKLPSFRLRKPRINYKKLFTITTVIGFALFTVSGYYYYDRLYLTNERRFWKAIENSLSLQSVTKEIQLGGTGNKTIEKTRFFFGASPLINKVSDISQISATVKSGVVTESIQTPTKQYVRYNNIFTNEKREDGTDFNFTDIKNTWAVQADATTPEEVEQAMRLYAQPHVTLAPFGNLPAASRREIVKALKDSGAYDISFDSATYEEVEGEEYLTFAAKVKTKQYVTVLQKFFTVSGLGDFPPLDPSAYTDNARVNTQFFVSTKDSTMYAIAFNGVTERYSNYGVTKKTPLPTSAITLEELQAKLGEVQ